jgi:hypothetical protein
MTTLAVGAMVASAFVGIAGAPQTLLGGFTASQGLR